MSATRHSRIFIAQNGDEAGAGREIAALIASIESGNIEEFRKEALALVERLRHLPADRTAEWHGESGVLEPQKAGNAAPA